MNVWQEAKRVLTTSPAGAERDEYIDTLADRVLMLSATPETEEALDVLIQALSLAQRELTLRSAALAVAVIAPSDNENAVDALLTAFRQHRRHRFLAPATLEALTLLALRNPVARLETAPLLIRLTPHDSRYLLIKSAKMITRLDPLLRSTELRQKLIEWRECSDLAVASEAAVQHAYLDLYDTLLSATTTELYQRLALTQVAFIHAAQMEEHRPDAELFACLVEMLLTFHNLPHDRNTTAQRLLELFDQLTTQIVPHWIPEYRSEGTNVCISHILGIADALKRAALSVRDADDWTNFDEALMELAALYSVMYCSDELLNDFALTPAASVAIADTLFVSQIGSVLHKTVGRRLARVTEKYVLAHGEDGTANGLRTLEHAVATIDQAQERETDPPSPHMLADLAHLASDLGQTPEEMLRSFFQARRHGHDAHWLSQLDVGLVPLPVDHPEFFDGNGPVHDASQTLLQQLDTVLHPYPPHRWMRLVKVVESIMAFAHLVFDTLPPYARCQEDGGKGKDASERDLQEHLFAWLRQHFDDQAIYEITPIGGGRVDTGLKFTDFVLPIEVKHEFTSITSEHIQTHYLVQADIYAAATGHISFLLILDLRDVHARKHRNRRAQARLTGEEATIVSQYGWDDGFWVETLPPDPQVPHAKTNAVVIGIIPGNRPRPSSTTTYSTRRNRPQKRLTNTSLDPV
jgi:hypothetical protein